MRPLLRSVAVLLAGLGCAPPEVATPEVPGAKSVLLLLASAEPRAFAHALDSDSLAVETTDDTTKAYLLYYDRTLAELDLLAGPNPLVAAGRAPSPTTHVFSAMVDGTSVGEWAVDELSAVSTFRLPRTAPQTCIQRGGCYSADLDDVCVTPCPAVEAPAPPDMVRPPEFHCPDGWPPVERTSIASATCEPFPGGFEPCDLGTMRLPGEAACRPIETCASGWPEPLPGGARHFVAVGGSGDGTEMDPFGTVEAAVEAADIGDLILVGAGQYAEPVHIDRAVTIWGRCVAQTSLGSITIGAPNVAIAHLSTERIRVGEGATLELEYASVRSSSVGLAIDRAGAADVRNADVRGGGTGVLVGPAATLTAGDVAVTASTALSLDEGASLTVTGALLHGVGDGLFSRGASASLSRTVLLGFNRGVVGRSAEITLHTVVVRNRLSDPFPGAVILDDGILEADHLLVEDSGTAMSLSGPVVAGLRDFAVINSPQETLIGFGIALTEGAQLTAERAAVHGARIDGISVKSSASLVGTDLFVSDTIGAEQSQDGRGLQVKEAMADITRLRAENNDSWAILAGSDGRLTLRDGLLVGNRRGGIWSPVSGVVSLQRAELRDNVGTALATGEFEGAPSITGSDITISGVARSENCGLAGRCLGNGLMSEVGTISLERFLLEAAEIGINASPDVELDLESGVIQKNGRVYQGPAYDLQRLLRTVHLRDNDELFQVE